MSPSQEYPTAFHADELVKALSRMKDTGLSTVRSAKIIVANHFCQTETQRASTIFCRTCKRGASQKRWTTLICILFLRVIIDNTTLVVGYTFTAFYRYPSFLMFLCYCLLISPKALKRDNNWQKITIIRVSMGDTSQKPGIGCTRQSEPLPIALQCVRSLKPM